MRTQTIKTPYSSIILRPRCLVTIRPYIPTTATETTTMIIHCLSLNYVIRSIARPRYKARKSGPINIWEFEIGLFNCTRCGRHGNATSLSSYNCKSQKTSGKWQPSVLLLILLLCPMTWSIFIITTYLYGIRNNDITRMFFRDPKERFCDSLHAHVEKFKFVGWHLWDWLWLQ